MPGADPAGLKVLLVEDDVLLGRALSDLLSRQGYLVTLLTHGRAAMDFLSTQQVALVISDIFMPDVDGIELLNFVRRFTPSPPFVAMSGAGSMRVSMLRMAGPLGATRTLSKPFNPAEFLGLVRELIGPAVTLPPANPASPAPQ